MSDRVESVHYFLMGASELEQVARPLPSTPGLDAVAIADVDGNGCNDVVGAGGYGRGLVHLGDGAGSFDGGQDLPQLGYQNPATATRVTTAVDDVTGDGLADLVVSDANAQQVMVFRNHSGPSGGSCLAPPPPPPPPPPPAVPRTCSNPGTTAFTVGTSGADVLVGTAGRDVLSGRGGDDCLFGLAGDDRVSGGTRDDKIRGSSGDDRLTGDAGDDDIRGDNGNDTITPGSGKDKVSAGGGNDAISARDEARDTIDCGAGRDKVTADRTDTVKSNCEYVKRAVRRARR